MSLTKNLSVILITKNEEKNIKRCLDSLTWVNEIVIADSHSTDQTIQIINSYSNTKIIDTDWLGFSDTKTLAIKHTTNDWILWIDADEEITQELRSEIESLSASSTNSNATSAYKINRANFFMDKRVRFSGWQNDWVTRLFKKSEVKFDGKAVHEKLIVTGAVKKLSSKMNHYTYQGLNHYMLKFEEYTLLGAQKRMDKIKRVNFNHLFLKPVFRFIRHYFLQLGILDGQIGLIISSLSAYNVFLRNLKLKRLLDGEKLK